MTVLLFLRGLLDFFNGTLLQQILLLSSHELQVISLAGQRPVFQAPEKRLNIYQ